MMSHEERRKSMRIMRRKLGAAVLPYLAPRFLSLLAKSWKVEQLGRENYEELLSYPARLVSMWHGRMLLPIRDHRELEAHVLVSPSDDGSLVTELIERFAFKVIRGSSNKSPARALRTMVNTLKAGATMVITPDGPRGPQHSVNSGPAWMARKLGCPILPCGFVCDRAWHLRSWDHFTIPKYGARVRLVYGDLIWVPKDADDAGLDRATELMRTSMLEAEKQGFRDLGMEIDW
jgi:lysophospholipid acyltransferase (LPLAT)-like uncharacterized protein